MKLVRIYTGDDGESHLDITDGVDLDFVERDGTRTAVHPVTGAQFAIRKEGHFSDFHNAPRRQYMMYLTATVEIGLGDGTTHTMQPGDVLLAEDTTGRGHSSRVIKGGMCVVVRIDP
jgi:hypothetical protein